MSLRSLRKEILELIESEAHLTEQITDSVNQLIEVIEEEQDKVEATEAGMRDEEEENGDKDAGCDDGFDEE
jgi:Mg2+ and Co2+ transporter CorA